MYSKVFIVTDGLAGIVSRSVHPLYCEKEASLVSMTVTVKSRTSIAVPPQLQRQAGFKPGDRVEFRVSGGVINIIPELPTADDEYTPKQRRAIDAQLAEGLADVTAGRTAGPFRTADE